jgi:uncharacterized protein (DUF1330 family)
MAAYIVAVCEITNFSEGMKEYVRRSEELIHKAGGEYLVRGPADKVLEGTYLPGKYTIVSKFPNMDALKSFAEGDEYVNEIKPLRAGTGTYEVAAFEETDAK